ncbi:MAG: nickel-dependent lactate racemase [Thermodesulfobacteriota bacterium]
MHQKVSLPWGESELSVMLPAGWKILGTPVPQGSLETKPPAEACAEALTDPIGCSRLASRDLSAARVVLVADDHSRTTPVAEFVGPVLDELQAGGLRHEHISFLLANGVHRKSTPKEVETKLGSEVAGRYPWRCHDAHDKSGFADFGTTSRGTRVFLNKALMEADLIICLGAVEPHLLLGFGGGLKMLVPGCAGTETIGRNHLQGTGGALFDYVGVRGDDSPMRLDLEEAALLSGREVFIVNAAMDERSRPVRFFCGDPVQAQRAAESFVEGLVGLEVPEQADVVLTNSFPMDSDLRQSAKCFGNWLHACRPGGVMMGCLRAEHGLGEIPLPKKTLPYSVMRALLKLIGQKRILGLVEKAKKGEPVEEVFIGHFGLQMLRRSHLGIFSDNPLLPQDVGRKMGLARSFARIEEMVQWASGKVPERASVWVVPFGGSTYARVGSP